MIFWWWNFPVAKATLQWQMSVRLSVHLSQAPLSISESSLSDIKLISWSLRSLISQLRSLWSMRHSTPTYSKIIPHNATFIQYKPYQNHLLEHSANAFNCPVLFCFFNHQQLSHQHNYCKNQHFCDIEKSLCNVHFVRMLCHNTFLLIWCFLGFRFNNDLKFWVWVFPICCL